MSRKDSKNSHYLALCDISPEEFSKLTMGSYRKIFGEVFTSDEWRIDQLAVGNHCPHQKEANEKYSDYYERLKKLWGKSGQVEEIHRRWKAKHRNGVLERDYKQRIYQQLKELMNSHFLHKDYIDTGIPIEDCEQACKDLKSEELGCLLEEVEGADWKYALISRHLRKPDEKHLLCDAENVGFYINDMREKLNWDDVEAFFRFDTFMNLVYIDMGIISDDEEEHHSDGPSDEESAVNEFVSKLCKLADDVYREWNDKEVQLGGRQGMVKVTIKLDELKNHIEQEKTNNFDDLALYCYPPTSKTKVNFCKYVAQLHKSDYFGKLPKNKLAEKIALIVGLSPGYVQGCLV